MSSGQKIAQLKELISETHKHGLKLIDEIQALEHGRHLGWQFHVWQKKGLLDGLKALNQHRYRELSTLEHPPAPAPQGRFVMFDAVNVLNIPEGVGAVAGYVDGWWPTYGEIVARFPHAKHLSVATSAAHAAKALDVENGDARPSEAPVWVRARHAEGDKTPWLYANLATMPEVKAKLLGNSIQRDEFRLWVADWDGVHEIPAGYDAVQFEDHEERYDVSLCAGYLL